MLLTDQGATALLWNKHTYEVTSAYLPGLISIYSEHLSLPPDSVQHDLFHELSQLLSQSDSY